MLREAIKPTKISLTDRPRCGSLLGLFNRCVHRLTVIFLHEIYPALKLAIPCIFVRTPFESVQCFEEGNFPGRETELMTSLLAKPSREPQLVRRGMAARADRKPRVHCDEFADGDKSGHPTFVPDRSSHPRKLSKPGDSCSSPCARLNWPWFPKYANYWANISLVISVEQREDTG